ncbi:uncharacterized protein LOC125544658 [Triticum urartu]|nr:uncharacterized protein LOC125544626 [Triticum urartu]XP_048564362.1 uncharacterized protein LOC125544658 [Triticum urartu]
MLRGGAGPRGGGGAAAASSAARPPRCPHPRPAPRRARATAGGLEPKGVAVSVLEDPVVSSVEESSFTFEFKRGSKRARKGMPPAEVHRGKENWHGEGVTNKQNMAAAKSHMTKEGPEEVEFTHCAPSIVARLMGLETVPRSKKVLDRCQSDIQSNPRLKLSGRAEEVARVSCEDRPCRSSGDELPELKDVFEVTEMENMATRKALQSGKEMPRPRSNDADLEFVRQKFLDAKRLSTDEGHRNSKEFGEALEILYSKKDVFLEILQESSVALSGFPGHILGYSGSQCYPHGSNGAGAQSFGQDNLCRMEVDSESEGPLSSVHLEETSHVPLEHSAPKGSRRSRRPSQIVVLKPDPQRRSSTPVLASQETSQFGQWTGARWLKPPRHSTHKQDGIHSMAHGSVQVSEPEGDTPEQKLRIQTSRRGSRKKPSENECYLGVGCQREKAASTSHDETSSISSSTHSAGSSVSRKARKHLSERWQMACQSKAENPVPTDTRTLGEMLELTARDATKVTTQKRLSDSNTNSSNAQEMPASPLGISSKDGWKTGIYRGDNSRSGISRNFPRSKSLPTSSTTIAKLPGRRRSAPNLPILKDILNTPTDDTGNGLLRKRLPIRKAKQNGRVIVHVGKENMLPEKEIYVTSERTRHSICTSDLPRTSNTYNEHPGDVISTEDHTAIDLAIPHEDVQNLKGQAGWKEQKLATPLPEAEDIVIHDQDIITLKEVKSQLMESDIAEIDHQAVKSAYSVSAESCECSSPTASSQQSSGEESTYSGIFKSVNDGIQGLRAQLKMLKMGDQVDTREDDSDAYSSDECDDTDISDYQVKEEQLPIFKDEEDRDCTYVQEMLGTACGFPVYPEQWQFSSDVFVWLENKYSKLLLWSKSDRKLLFDLVNSILADMTAPGSSLCSKIMMNSWPQMDWRKLAENVWRTAVFMRRSHQPFDLDSVEPLPLDHHPELEMFGADIAEMIRDDILEELVAELASHIN